MTDITIKLPADKWNIVMTALGEMPLKSVVDVWAEIKGQADAQIKAIEEEEKAKDARMAEAEAKIAELTK